MDRRIVDYYDRLAPTYDVERFGNSYGRFIDSQERAILVRAILGARLPHACGRVLDLGCGTGRLMDFATHGCDPSLESLRRAAKRHPEKQFAASDAISLPFANGSFDAIFCFHVLMHLSREDISAVLAEIGRVLRPGGVFVADIASGLRRSAFRRSRSGWHGATSLTSGEFARLGHSAGLRLQSTSGVGLIPVHRIPETIRGYLVSLDRVLGAVIPDLASYIVCSFRREAGE